MPDLKINTEPLAMEGALGDLHRAHIRLVALQRNINALLLQYRDMQQEVARAESEFLEMRQRVHKETGLEYNDQTLTLEQKNR